MARRMASAHAHDLVTGCRIATGSAFIPRSDKEWRLNKAAYVRENRQTEWGKTYYPHMMQSALKTGPKARRYHRQYRVR